MSSRAKFHFDVHLLVGLLPILPFGAAAQTTLLNDSFVDLDRTNQALPESAAWYYGAHHATAANAFTSLNASSGSLVWDHSNAGNNSFSAIWAYLTPSGSPVSLLEGETIRLTFDVSFSGGSFSTSGNAFRFSLFNSGGNRVSQDFAGTSEAGIAFGTTFSGWRGYEATLPVNTTANATADFILRERTGSGNGLNTSGNWTTLAGSTVAEPLFAASTTYSGVLEITRVPTGAEVRAGIANVFTPAVIDTASPFLSFDTVQFFSLDSLSHDITLDNIQVSVVPEPSSAAVVAFGAVALLLRRRR
jgi:hypothetical protein